MTDIQQNTTIVTEGCSFLMNSLLKRTGIFLGANVAFSLRVSG
jgi:hypothetical protein